MLRLRSCILSHLRSSTTPTTVPPFSSLCRFLSITDAPPTSSPDPGFVVKDYLVATCGLTHSQALKASAELSHIKSSSKADAVLAFLRDLGLSSADVAAVVAKDPMFLCARVERTLAPNVADLTDLGLTHSDIARYVRLASRDFRRRTICRKIGFVLPIFGSSGKLLQGLRYNNKLLSSDLESVIKPGVKLLRGCGLGDCDIAKLWLSASRLLNANSERLQAMVACAESLGVPRSSRMFRHALAAVSLLSQEKLAAKVEYLRKAFRWSDAEVRTAVSKAPLLLKRSTDRLQLVSEFLISEVGLEPVHIAERSQMIGYSLEGRLRPRYYVLKFLKANGLMKPERSYYSAVTANEKVFSGRYICPYKEAAPGLAEDYAAACRGEVPTRFRFPEPRTGSENV